MQLHLQPTPWKLWTSPTALSDCATDAVLTRIWDSYNQEIRDGLEIAMDGDWSFTSPRGKLLTRINKFMYKRNGHDLDEYDRRYIERQITDSNTPPFHYKVTDKLTWRKGAYKDADSCFWTYNWWMRGVLVAAGGMAILVKEDEAGKRGRALGRAFVAPFENSLVVSNITGLGMAIYTKLIRHELGVTVHEHDADYNIYVKNDYGGIIRGFYDGVGTKRLSLTQDYKGYDLKPVVEPCRCVASHQGMTIADKEVCANCPFTRRFRVV